jgi:hypothetical protein
MRQLLFLSHAGVDTEAALRIADLIENTPEARQHGLKVWIDKRHLQAGQSWQHQLEDVIENQSTAFAVYLGNKGVINWVENEVRLALSRTTGKPDYPFIPIITKQSRGARALPGFARQFQGVHDIESDPEELTKLLRAVLRRDRAQGLQLVDHPFKGLLAFDTADTHLFFGREAEARELLEQIKQHALVMVVGDSGSGKSSLVKAGLIPLYLGGELGKDVLEYRYERVWVSVQTRPRTNPFGSLADDLEETANTLGVPADKISEIKRLAREQVAQSVYDALRLAIPDNAEVLLFVDQLEELFTNASPEDREAFIKMLQGLTAQPGKTPVHLVLAMRRDYYNLCSQYKAFFELTENGRFSVKRMQDTKLEACVRKPLVYTPLKDDANFAKAVVADVGDQPGDLALMQLAVTLAWDWHADYPSLTEAYSATGRVTGALAKLADEVYHNKLSDAERELVEPLLIRLVRLGDTAGATRRIVGRNELSAETWALAQKLASQEGGRLLVTGGDEHQATIELSHEALVTQCRTPDMLFLTD